MFTCVAARFGLESVPDPNDGLEVAVEGRTVYLKGALDAGVAASAANAAQLVDGVAAVVLAACPRSECVRAVVRHMRSTDVHRV